MPLKPISILIGTFTLTYLLTDNLTKAQETVNSMAETICRENIGHFYSLYSQFEALDLTQGQQTQIWQVSTVYFIQFDAIMAAVGNTALPDMARIEQIESRYKRDLQTILTPRQWRILPQINAPRILGVTPQQQTQLDWLQRRFEVEMSVFLPQPTPLQTAQAETLEQAYEQQLQAILTPAQYQQWEQTDQRLTPEGISHIARCTL